MYPYIATFGISALLVAYAEQLKCKHVGDKIFRCLAISLSVICLCVLAGARNEGVGTDTAGYGRWLYELALLAGEFPNFMDDALTDYWHMEPLFAAQAYVVVKLLQSEFWYYFFIQLAILAPLYRVLWHFCSGRNVWVPILVYCFVFFGMSLNAMRQYVGMSFVLLAFMYLTEGAYRKCVVAAVVGVLYHTSALLGIFVLLCFALVTKRSEGSLGYRSGASFLGVFVFLAAIVVVIRGRNLIRALLESIGPLSKYLYVVNGEGELHLAYYLLTAFLVGAILLWGKKHGLLHDPVFTFSVAVVALSLFTQTFEAYSQPLQRLSKCLLVFCMIPISMCASRERPGLQMSAQVIFPLAYGICFFLFYYVSRSSSDIIPYTSTLLGLVG